MRLCRVAVRNFRCIDQLEIFPKGFTSLIGPNNAGKSSTLRAVELLLNQHAPAADEWRYGHEKEPIEIEADFDELKDWERAKPGISSLVYDNKIKLRLRVLPVDAASGRKTPESSYECFKPEEKINGWSDAWGELDPDIKAKASEAGINGAAWRTSANKEKVRQIIRDTMPDRVAIGDAQWTSEGISIPAAFQQAIPQAQLIPAIRDAEKDGAPGAGTSFGLLLKSIILPAVSTSDEYKALMTAVTELERKLRGDGAEQLPAVQTLAKSISDRLSDLITAKVSLGMEPPDAEKFIGANTVLRIDDGTSTRIALQGHGLQRALVFAMLEVLASQKAAGDAIEGQPVNSRCTVLLFEEPELFIHPHLMRRLKEILAKISKRNDWQVIASTHSPFLVDVADDPCSLVIHRRPSPQNAPSVIQLKENPFALAEREEERERLRAVLDFHPTVCEAFFARHVVLVEGDTEVAVLNRQALLYSLSEIDITAQREATIVSCDGQWTIVPIARLLRAFGIPVRAIHDQDRKGKSDAELAADLKHEWHANARISEVVGAENVFAVDDTFEHVLWKKDEAPKSSKDKPYRAWRRVRELCDGKTNLDHAPALRSVVQFAFKPFTAAEPTNLN